jgi:RNA polymerase sigma-70 factor (ECF subfamily)
MTPLVIVGSGSTPVLGKEESRVTAGVGEVGGIELADGRITFDRIVEAVDKGDEVVHSSRDLVDGHRTICGALVIRPGVVLDGHDVQVRVSRDFARERGMPMHVHRLFTITEPTVANPESSSDGVDANIAFEKHVLPELDVLYRTARSLTRNPADAEDLVQDTLLRAFRAIERFDGRYPRAWLLTIMRNANINRARKKKPDLLDDPDAIFERSTEFAENVTPEDEVVEPVFDAVVQDAFNRLSDDFRQVVELVDLNGLAYKEAADLLGVPVGTVMSRLHRARKRIRDEISERGLDAERNLT